VSKLLLIGKIADHKQFCKPLAEVRVVRSQKWDAYGCLDCGQWLEKKCSDKECEFCASRPEVFLDAFILYKLIGLP